MFLRLLTLVYSCAVLRLADTAAAREFRSSDYQLFAEQQQRAAAVLPKTWEWLQRSPTRDDDFMGITLTFRGRRIIYHPKDAETLPIPRREKQGAREQVTVTIWPANYRPRRTNAIEQLRTFGEAGDSPEPIAGDDRIKITAEANFDSTTTASTWPTWKADLIRALKLRALPPSPRPVAAGGAGTLTVGKDGTRHSSGRDRMGGSADATGEVYSIGKTVRRRPAAKLHHLLAQTGRVRRDLDCR